MNDMNHADSKKGVQRRGLSIDHSSGDQSQPVITRQEHRVSRPSRLESLKMMDDGGHSQA